MGGAQEFFPLFPRGPADGFHALNAKRLYDSLGQHGETPYRRAGYKPCSRIFRESATTRATRKRRVGALILLRTCAAALRDGPVRWLHGSLRVRYAGWKTRPRAPTCG